MEPNPYPRLELGEDMRQQQAEWRLQRVVWPLLFGVLLAAFFQSSDCSFGYG